MNALLSSQRKWWSIPVFLFSNKLLHYFIVLISKVIIGSWVRKNWLILSPNHNRSDSIAKRRLSWSLIVGYNGNTVMDMIYKNKLNMLIVLVNTKLSKREVSLLRNFFNRWGCHYHVSISWTDVPQQMSSLVWNTILYTPKIIYNSIFQSRGA